MLTKKQVANLKNIHENIRNILIDNECTEHWDCIIDEICKAVNILDTTVYYIEGE